MSYKFPKAPTDKIIKDERGNVYKFPKAPTGIKVFANKNVQKLMKELENDKKEREKDKRLDDNLRELRRKIEENPVLKKPATSPKLPSFKSSLDLEEGLKDIKLPSFKSSLDLEEELKNIDLPFGKGNKTRKRSNHKRRNHKRSNHKRRGKRDTQRR